MLGSKSSRSWGSLVFNTHLSNLRYQIFTLAIDNTPDNDVANSILKDTYSTHRSFVEAKYSMFDVVPTF